MVVHFTEHALYCLTLRRKGAHKLAVLLKVEPPLFYSWMNDFYDLIKAYQFYYLKLKCKFFTLSKNQQKKIIKIITTKYQGRKRKEKKKLFTKKNCLAHHFKSLEFNLFALRWKQIQKFFFSFSVFTLESNALKAQNIIYLPLTP